MTRSLSWLFSKTLNNVWFGITMMLLVALYVAIGSGRADVREYFEMDELAFFNAWPLKVLMVLLVANLVTVTFIRIPFTPPRYGVWMIHTGIVVLIYGMAYYYSFKQEGLSFIMKGQSASYFYDNWERSLYARVDGINTGDDVVLGSLPRFHVYDPKLGEHRKLSGSDLRGIEPTVRVRGQDGSEQITPLAKMLGMSEPLTLDVVGYWPYARVRSEWASAGEGGATGLEIKATDAKDQPLRRLWLVSDDAKGGGHHEQLEELELEHRHVPSEEALASLEEAPRRIHLLEIAVGGENVRAAVDLGQTVKVGGYELTVEGFDPAWQTMDRQTVQLLTVMVKSPTQMFRRQLIPGRERWTDWKLNVPGAGPMGQRQTEPLDKGLVTRYEFNDALGLLPKMEGAREKRTIVTSPKRTLLIATSLSRPARVAEVEGGHADLVFGDGDAKVTLHVQRQENLRRFDDVQVVPRELRDENAGRAGLYQVVAVKATSGSWQQTFYVPYQRWALTSPWNAGVLRLPNGRSVQFQLGNRVRPIAPDVKTGAPATVTLDEFELVSYAGGSSMSGLQRDFKSKLTIREGGGQVRKDKAHMNNPVYFGGTPVFGLGDTYWTLFQAQWDPQGQRFTVLGVGNRPGVWIMTFGSVLLSVGLLYAFYVKPLIIRRMKERAIAEAKAKGKPVKAEPKRPVVVEGVEGRISV